MEKINIRFAVKNDIEQIDNLLYQVHKIHADARPDLFIQGEKKYTDEELLDIINNREYSPVLLLLLIMKSWGMPFVK